MKLIFSFLFALAFNTVMGATLAPMMGLDPLAGSITAVGISLIPFQSMMGVNLYAGVLQEMWTGELIKQFRHEGSFLTVIRDANNYVNNDVIHLVDVGADPDVLINNNTYPIAVVTREDADVSISLDKFDTVNTRVTRDELYAITYDKIGSVVEQHNEVLEEKTIEKSLHALAPAANSTDTPVFGTTGAANGAIKRAAVADFITMKRKFDDAKVPKMNRHVVLCNEHIEDLLNTDEKFAQQYMNVREGQILKLHGWQVHESTYNPVYDTLAKEAYGAAADADSRNASIFFYAPRAFKARGTTEMFYKDKSENPEFRETVVGFQLRYICLPKKWVGFGALVTADS